jgi:3D (Asp-Asp-Asp) domain-containing protein
MALQLTLMDTAPWAGAQAGRKLRLALEVDERAIRTSVQSSNPNRRALGMAFSFVRVLLLLIAICLPMVARSLHVQEGAAFLSESLSKRSGDPRMEAGSRSRMVASSRLRSLLSDQNVSADLVSTLHNTLVSENSAQTDSRNMSARLPLGNVVTQPPKLANSHSDFMDRFFKTSARSKKGIASKSRLARLTTYWPDEGDDYTKRGLSSTGVKLRDGHCAVDPKVIPYGSLVKVPGVGELVAVDTGPAVASRQAARKSGRNSGERSALVIDIYCSSRSKARAVEASNPKFAVITWSR